MAVDLAIAYELAEIASEAGADVFSGDFRYPLDAGTWLPYGMPPKFSMEGAQRD